MRESGSVKLVWARSEGVAPSGSLPSRSALAHASASSRALAFRIVSSRFWLSRSSGGRP